MKNNLLRLSLFALLPLSLIACQAAELSAPGSSDALIAEGKAIVQAQCSSCHAVGLSGQSPRVDAPPLRTVLANYNAESLADDFREHIHVGHPDMPDFDFGPQGTDEVIAYLKSIQEDPTQ